MLSAVTSGQTVSVLPRAYNGGLKDLNNRVALVTGGSRGIGAAVAVALAGAGADVAVNYRERADAANAVCGEITGMGRKAIAVPADAPERQPKMAKTETTRPPTTNRRTISTRSCP